MTSKELPRPSPRSNMKHFISLVLATERQFYAGTFAVLACLWCAIGAATLVLPLLTLLPITVAGAMASAD